MYHLPTINKTGLSRTNRRFRRLIFAAAAVLLCLRSPVDVHAAELADLIEEESDSEWAADSAVPEDGLAGINGIVSETWNIQFVYVTKDGQLLDFGKVKYGMI